MKITFLKDGESPEFGPFRAGEVREVDNETGEALLAYGIAEKAAEPRPFAARPLKKED